jgi:hypothetical protein
MPRRLAYFQDCHWGMTVLSRFLRVFALKMRHADEDVDASADVA